MERIAIFPGSFDPFTVGHENLVRRGLKLFDKIIVGVGYNAKKEYFFPVETRVNFIKEEFKDDPCVSVEPYNILTVDFAKEKNARFILRGLRTAADFEYERAIAQINRQMTEIETVFMLTTPQHTPINSSIVRDILRYNGDASKFIPPIIYQLILRQKDN